jgi:hypothetical protein
MPNIPQVALGDDSTVEHATLSLADLGRAGQAYTVRLAGWVDERWIDLFQRERRESRSLSRFELDPATRMVSFGVDPGADPADVIDALDILDRLVARVNEHALRER